MSSNISIKGSLSLSQTNTPTRVGERVSTELDLFNIETPYIGMIVYIADQDKYVYVKSLKSKKVGFKYVEDAQVDEYLPFATGEGVKDITLSGSTITITYSDNSTKNIYLPASSGGGNTYVSKIEDKNVAMTTEHGDFKVGTKVSALEGKSYDELFDGILFPTLNPSHGTPSLTGFVVSNTLVELGNDVLSVTEAQLKRATWTTYNNGMPYTGEVKSIIYNFNINNNSYSQISDLDNKVYESLGNQTYKATINYDAGQPPKNNKGVVVGNLACPEGKVEATRTINVTAPWYVYSVKQPLITWNNIAGAMSTGEFDVDPHTSENPQMFKLPRRINKLQMYNTVAKQFETVQTSDWNETSQVESINGINHVYYTYTYKGSARGSVKLKANF